MHRPETNRYQTKRRGSWVKAASRPNKQSQPAALRSALTIKVHRQAVPPRAQPLRCRQRAACRQRCMLVQPAGQVGRDRSAWQSNFGTESTAHVCCGLPLQWWTGTQKNTPAHNGSDSGSNILQPADQRTQGKARSRPPARTAPAGAPTTGRTRPGLAGRAGCGTPAAGAPRRAGGRLWRRPVGEGQVM